MIILPSPIAETRNITGYEINEYNEAPGGKFVRASVRVYFQDGKSEVRDLTLWAGQTPAPTEKQPKPAKVPNEYADAGEWTTADAARRIEEELAK